MCPPIPDHDDQETKDIAPPLPSVDQPMGFEAPGTLTQISPNRARCIFTIDEYLVTYDVTVIPSMERFTCTGNLKYSNRDDFTGTLSFNGYVGPGDFEIGMVKGEDKVASFSGTLKDSIRVKHQVSGTGIWMSS